MLSVRRAAALTKGHKAKCNKKRLKRVIVKAALNLYFLLQAANFRAKPNGIPFLSAANFIPTLWYTVFPCPNNAVEWVS
jgi:hypothetical protein